MGDREMTSEDLPLPGEDVLAWTMRVRRLTFAEAVEHLVALREEPAPVPEED
jgi:hypothetical protein